MSRTGNSGQMEKRRRDILAAAERVFDANGYAATTVDAVAAAAGVSKGSMYNYFRNKLDLFTQVFSEAVARNEREAATFLTGSGSATEKIEALLAFWAGRLEHDRRLGGLLLEFWATAARQGQGGEMASWFSEMYARWRGMIQAVIAQGKDEGVFTVPDAAVAAALMLAVLDGIMVQTILSTGLKVDDEFLAALNRAVFNSLMAKPPA